MYDYIRLMIILIHDMEILRGKYVSEVALLKDPFNKVGLTQTYMRLRSALLDMGQSEALRALKSEVEGDKFMRKLTLISYWQQWLQVASMWGPMHSHLGEEVANLAELEANYN